MGRHVVTSQTGVVLRDVCAFVHVRVQQSEHVNPSEYFYLTRLTFVNVLLINMAEVNWLWCDESLICFLCHHHHH